MADIKGSVTLHGQILFHVTARHRQIVQHHHTTDHDVMIITLEFSRLKEPSLKNWSFQT